MNPLFSRQLRKAFGFKDDLSLEQWLSKLNNNELENNQEEFNKLRTGLAALLPRVEDSYEAHVRDIVLRDRSLQLSSEELMSANQKIRHENKAQHNVIEMLRVSVNKLLTELDKPIIEHGYSNLSDLSHRVLELIDEQKVLRDTLKEDRRFYRSITNSIGEGVYAVDGNDNLRFLNPTASKLLGWTFEELQKRAFHDTVHYQRKDGTLISRDECDISNHIQQGVSYTSYEEYFTDQNGRIFPVSIVAVPLLDANGDPDGHVGVFSDISDQKATKQKLEKAYKEAQSANKAKSNFLATISHEIRTPMNAIIGLTHLAIEATDSDQKQDYLKKVKDSATSLLELINSILDFSKVEANKVQINNEPYMLARPIEKLAQVFQLKAREKQLQLLFDIQFDININCLGDSEKLYQVLMNLVGNAIKFTEKGYVLVQIKREDNRVYFAVSDTGMGISEKGKAVLFDAFVQADASISRKYGGTGLGLTISKHLVELMGGKLEFESEVNVGSTFSFSLPFSNEGCCTTIPSQRAHLAVNNVTCLMAGMTVDKAGAILQRTYKRLGVSCNLVNMDEDTLPEDAQHSIIMLSCEEKPWTRFLNLLKFGEFKKLGLSTLISPLSKADVIKRMGALYFNDLDIIELPFTDEELKATLSESKQTVALTAEYGLEGKKLRKKRLTGKHVLVVEDDIISFEITQQMLSSFDISVSHASNGEQALSLCEHQVFDALILDCNLPGISGYDVAEKLTHRQQWNTPILALSANESDEAKSLDAGMCEHLIKPATVEEIIHALDVHIHSGYLEVQATHHNEDFINSLIAFYEKYRQPEIMTNLLSHLSSPEADTSVLTVMSSDAKDIGANSLVHELDKVLNFADRKHKGFANSVSRVSIALDATMRLIAHTIDMQSDVTFDFDKKSLQEQLNQIITALENYDAEAINKIALLVSEYGHTTYAHHINHIKQNANMYDFEGALDAAIQLRGLLDNDD